MNISAMASVIDNMIENATMLTIAMNDNAITSVDNVNDASETLTMMFEKEGKVDERNVENMTVHGVVNKDINASPIKTENTVQSTAFERMGLLWRPRWEEYVKDMNLKSNGASGALWQSWPPPETVDTPYVSDNGKDMYSNISTGGSKRKKQNAEMVRFLKNKKRRERKREEREMNQTFKCFCELCQSGFATEVGLRMHFTKMHKHYKVKNEGKVSHQLVGAAHHVEQSIRNACCVCGLGASNGSTFLSCSRCNAAFVHGHCIPVGSMLGDEWRCLNCRSGSNSGGSVPAHKHHDDCGVCGDGGNLVMCDSCNYVFHYACVNLHSEPENDDWQCPICVKSKEWSKRFLNCGNDEKIKELELKCASEKSTKQRLIRDGLCVHQEATQIIMMIDKLISIIN